METAVSKQQESRPEFVRLIDRITFESSVALELAARIRQLTGILMPFNESGPIDDSTSPIMPGVIGDMWIEVEKIRRANLSIEETMHHLEKMVGQG